MTKLSVNVNKIATLRNARGGAVPNLVAMVKDIESFGAEGITIHPRPDERHITKQDVYDLKKVVTTEFNIEGYPSEEFLALVSDVKPEQVTLVPDPPHVLTSNAGWDARTHGAFLKEVVSKLKSLGSRVSIFLDPDPEMVQFAAETGTDRIELYTEAYAKRFHEDKEEAVLQYVHTAQEAVKLGIGINAGHDLDHKNLAYFVQEVPEVLEVSIGHALISDALYWGIENTVQLYKKALRK